ncbi:hypothetical protein BBB37_01330 [Bordetella pertussis]|nr:hypothetical protein BBB37_01330 [Bordetella pertussis]CFW03167.1 Uncharacterised protein [Bordetella pertussis]
MLCLLILTTCAGHCDTRPATSMARASALPPGTTQSTRPSSLAWALGIFSPSSTICLAMEAPTMFTSRGIAFQLRLIPIWASGTNRYASSAITRQSQHSVSATPPPTFMPSMAATVICGSSSQARHMRVPRVRIWRCSLRLLPARSKRSGSVRSTPALNAARLPPSTTHVMSWRSFSASAVAVRSRMICIDIAFFFSPRS